MTDDTTWVADLTAGLEAGSLTAAAAKRALIMIGADPSDTPAEVEGLLVEALEDLVTVARVLAENADGTGRDTAPVAAMVRDAVKNDASRERLDAAGSRPTADGWG